MGRLSEESLNVIYFLNHMKGFPQDTTHTPNSKNDRNLRVSVQVDECNICKWWVTRGWHAPILNVLITTLACYHGLWYYDFFFKLPSPPKKKYSSVKQNSLSWTFLCPPRVPMGFIWLLRPPKNTPRWLIGDSKLLLGVKECVWMCVRWDWSHLVSHPVFPGIGFGSTWTWTRIKRLWK